MEKSSFDGEGLSMSFSEQYERLREFSKALYLAGSGTTEEEEIIDAVNDFLREQKPEWSVDMRISVFSVLYACFVRDFVAELEKK